MPRYSKAVPCQVEIANYKPLYGFPCRASEATKGALGIVTFNSSADTVFGANRPKPPRAMYMTAKQTSFLDKAKPADGVNVRLVAAGKPPVGPGSGKVYVNFYGLKWVWTRPTEVATRITTVAGYGTLGVTDYSAQTEDALYGCSSVFIKSAAMLINRPLRAYKKDGENRLSSFASTPMTAETTWTVE